MTTRSEDADFLGPEQNKISAYFSHVVSELGGKKDVHILAVAHMVPNALCFLPALNNLGLLSAVLPKPKTVGRPEFKTIKNQFNIVELSREWASQPDNLIKKAYKLGLQNKRLVLVDIGGYFADSANDFAEKFDGEFLGIMEGTENGVQKYEAIKNRNYSLVTVARSPLKLPEDYLVASSVIFSVEAVLREQAEILQTRTAAVLGYGRVGSAMCEILRGRGINTVVFDKNPICLAEAAARGFRACLSRDEALQVSSLVICATGNKALDIRGFAQLNSGTIVASVTSADDELDFAGLDAGYVCSCTTPNLTKYEENRNTGRFFSLISNGNAANFIHGAVIGPAIQLIEGEKLAAVAALSDGQFPNNEISELPMLDRKRVATIWNEHFLH